MKSDWIKKDVRSKGIKLNKRIKFEVSFALPEDATGANAKDYVVKALKIHLGSLEAGVDPMFYLNTGSIWVKEI